MRAARDRAGKNTAFALCVLTICMAETVPLLAVLRQEHCLCRVCFHCLRGQDTAFTLCVFTAFIAKTLPFLRPVSVGEMGIDEDVAIAVRMGSEV